MAADKATIICNDVEWCGLAQRAGVCQWEVFLMLDTENFQHTALLIDFPHTQSQHWQNQDCCRTYRLQEWEIYIHNQANQPLGISKQPLEQESLVEAGWTNHLWTYYSSSTTSGPSELLCDSALTSFSKAKFSSILFTKQNNMALICLTHKGGFAETVSQVIWSLIELHTWPEPALSEVICCCSITNGLQLQSKWV